MKNAKVKHKPEADTLHLSPCCLEWVLYFKTNKKNVMQLDCFLNCSYVETKPHCISLSFPGLLISVV